MPSLDYLIVCVVALVASALTLFSGFGLGTLLLPAFAFIFPVEIAVAATAVVHLLNNVFKLALIGRNADRGVVLRFGVPALFSAFAGAWLLSRLSDLGALVEYRIGSHPAAVTPVKLVVAVLILGFALLELLPAAGRFAFDRRWIPLGGLLSGFFGGLSGHQGAMRSAFLIKAGLGKEGFVGTGVACAVLVDLARLTFYGAAFLTTHFSALHHANGTPLVAAATVAAFAGAVIGVRLLGRITLPTLHRIVGVLLLVVAMLLGAGV